MNDISRHYDLLIDMGNDPVHDPPALRAYMDGWDGARFLSLLELTQEKSVLEIGVGTGRLAVQTAPLCGHFTGVDLSEKTIERAGENLAGFSNVSLACGDFLTWKTAERFDVIYSSLTFMHIPDKEAAIRRVASLLTPGGRFVLSLDRDPREVLDIGVNRIGLYPDDPARTAAFLGAAGMQIVEQYQTEQAWVFAAVNTGK